MPTLNIKGFPEDLYHNLEVLAKKERRSLSGEVIYLLEWAIEAATPKKKSILSLRGLGKQYWKNIDPVEHVSKERDTWE